MTFLKGMLFPAHRGPLNIRELEAENFAWIDFFWSTMGRSGQVGQDVEVIYEKLQYAAGFKDIIENLSKSLAERFDLPGWGDWMEGKIINSVLKELMRRLSKRERGEVKSSLSLDAKDGLEEFMRGPLYKQILEENNDVMPDDVTIVFGHTHKPFQLDIHCPGYPQWVNVYNSGGWVVETVVPKPAHGGAVILLDKNLNATSLRMFNEAADSSQYQVRVEEARHAGEKNNPFHERISGLVNPSEDPWKSFSNVVAADIRKRAKNLDKRIKKRGYVQEA
jgi:hypothetical protein